MFGKNRRDRNEKYEYNRCQRFLDGLTEIFLLLSGTDNCEIAAPNCSILSTTCGGICLKTSRLLCARSSEESTFDDGNDIETTFADDSLPCDAADDDTEVTGAIID